MKSLLILKAGMAILLCGASFVSMAQESPTPVTQTTEVMNLPVLHAKSGVPNHKQAAISVTELPVVSRDELLQTESVDYWFYDAWMTLNTDRDYDGFYSGFRLEFDADSNYYRSPVYAVVYLGTHDLYTAFHVTSTFELFSDSSEDSVVLESELVSGFPTAQYDVLIELYDAYSDQLVATIDAYSDADMAYQSLESLDFDQPVTREVVIEHHGGSWGVWGIIALAIITVIRRVQTRKK